MSGGRVVLFVAAAGCFVAATELGTVPRESTRAASVVAFAEAARPLQARAVVASRQQGTSNPHGDIAFSCADCHTTESWTTLRDPLAFDHADTGYPLVGNHVGPDCADCHESLQFAAVATACADCHTDVHRGEMGFACSSCHSEVGWSDRRQMYVFHFTTGFPLLGGHASVDCEACHRPAPPFEFSSTPTDCVSCHREDYRQTSDPDHVASGFGLDCESCHTIDSWRGARIPNHDFFPLEGGHAFVPCASCHVDGFAGTPTDCYSCHADDYRNTRDPNHEQAGFPTDCEQCHTIRDWDAEFDHDAVFPLVAAHADLECASCHADGYAGTPTDCFGCHARDYRDTTDPDHRAADFPTACESCHDQRAWANAVLDHDAFFQLQGAHRSLECESCHRDGYAGTPTDCLGCHARDYRNTTDPDHRAAGFPTECETCHDQRRWQGATFDHDAFFQLQGAHRSLECDSCHRDGYAGTPTDCFDCHARDYRNTTDPDHRAAGFPTECETCHDQRRWQGATFDHDAFFRLQGAHRTLECESCHRDGYAGTPTDCYGCHASDYRNTNDPNHQTAGFPTDCTACHDQNSWEGAVFDHDAFFRLEGAHRSLGCESCHRDGYAGTPTDCYSCHTSDYRNTNDPNHQAAGFPTDCDLCHDQRSWDGAEFDHRAFFPIYSGSHAGAWNTCADCHVQPGNFAAFECILCHAHGQAEMASRHNEVGSYQWVSTACYSCHPQGRADDD